MKKSCILCVWEEITFLQTLCLETNILRNLSPLKTSILIINQYWIYDNFKQITTLIVLKVMSLTSWINIILNLLQIHIFASSQKTTGLKTSERQGEQEFWWNRRAMRRWQPTKSQLMLSVTLMHHYHIIHCAFRHI